MTGRPLRVHEVSGELPSAVGPYADLKRSLGWSGHVEAGRGLGFAVKVRLVVWGVDAQHAGIAQLRAEHYARTFHFTIISQLASYGTAMSAAPLVDLAVQCFTRREVDYGHAWWLVPHAAISRLDFDRAHSAVHAMWAAELADHGETSAAAPHPSRES